MTAIKDLFASKKFIMLLLGAVATVVLQQLGIDEATILKVTGLFGTGILGQGIADHGKSAEQIRAAVDAESPADVAAALEAS